MKCRQTKILTILGMMFALAGFECRMAQAEGESPHSQPWEKFGVSLGAFVSDTNSSVRVGSGLGVELDPERLLGLESKSTVFRVDSNWRFSHNRRHRVDLSWYAFRRSANKQVGEDFDVTNPDGSITTVQAGSKVESHFNLDIIQTAYSYSFFQDDRADLAVGAGFYVMPINFGLQASGLSVAETSLKFTAPLPVLGLRMDFALTPKWFMRSGYQIFYVEYQGFKGKLSEMRGAVEYLPFKHFGFGLGLDSLQVSLEGSGKDYPNVDLSGSANFGYTGLQLYGKYFF
jgi:hypothetical protein